jgi:hypothetical protein
MNGHTEVVIFLLREVDFPLNVPKFSSAVRRACEGGQTTTLKLLADLGADLEKENGEEKTPLLMAACSGSLTCVRVLHARGVRLNSSESAPRQYVEVVEASGLGRIDVVRELINVFGAAPHETDKKGGCGGKRAEEGSF